jgi:hypothetical protein
MTATRSERGLDDGEVAREYADAEVLANALEHFRAGRYAEAEAEAEAERSRPMRQSSSTSRDISSANII